MLCPQPRPPVPAETARIVRAAFPKGHAYLAAADALGEVFTDDAFVALFPGTINYGVSSVEQDGCSHQVDCAEEVALGLVVPGGYGTGLFQGTEEVLDQMARLVEIAVVLALYAPPAAPLGHDCRPSSDASRRWPGWRDGAGACPHAANVSAIRS